MTHPHASTDHPGAAALSAARQPSHRGQRRHRQDLHHRRAVPAAGAGPWRRGGLRAAAGAARDPGRDLHRGRPRRSCATASARAWPRRPTAFLADPVRHRACTPAGQDLLHDLRDRLPALRSGPAARARCAWRPSGWTRPPCPPSTAGATACCASTPSTAAACSRRRSRPTSASCRPRSCATTGAAFSHRWGPPMDAAAWCAAGGPRPRRLQRQAGSGSSRPRLQRWAKAHGRRPRALQAQARSHAGFAAMKRPWVRNGSMSCNCCWTMPWPAKQVHGTKLQARYYQPWLDGLRSLGRRRDAVLPLPDKSTGWTRLTPPGLAEVFKDGHAAPGAPRARRHGSPCAARLQSAARRPPRRAAPRRPLVSARWPPSRHAARRWVSTNC